MSRNANRFEPELRIGSSGISISEQAATSVPVISARTEISDWLIVCVRDKQVYDAIDGFNISEIFGNS